MTSCAPVAAHRTLALILTLSLSCNSNPAPGPETTDSYSEITPSDNQPPPVDTAWDAIATDLNQGDEAVSVPDATSDVDVSQTDASGTSTAWGNIQGSCGGLSLELGLATPSFFANEYIFEGGASFDPSGLSPGPKQRYEGPNAGGSSKCSEVMSMQLLIDCEGAIIHKTEVEIEYTTEGAMTDYVALMADQKVGVSVTRAYLGPFVEDYNLADATELLTKKLNAVQESTNNVSPEDLWVKQILHVWTLHSEWAETVQQAWDGLEPTIRADTIVLITVESQSDLIVTDACAD